MNGAGGTCIRNAMVVSSSGALAAIGSRLRRTSRVGGMNSAPPRIHADRIEARTGSGSTTPKLPPPPRTAQNRSGCSSSLAVMRRPSAVTISTATQGVDGQAVLADEPADAAAERQAGDADRAGVTERGGEAVSGRGVGVLAGRQPGAGPGEAAVGVDVQALHRAQVEDDAAVDACRSRPGCGRRCGPRAAGPVSAARRRPARRRRRWRRGRSAPGACRSRRCGPGGPRRRPRCSGR